MDLEKVEKLREKANVSYEEAQKALEVANEDLLDALIELERQGKVKPPENAGFYSSQQEGGEGLAGQNADGARAVNPGQDGEKAYGPDPDHQYHHHRQDQRRHSQRESWYQDEKVERHARQKARAQGLFSEFCGWLGRIVHKGNTNFLDVKKRANFREDGRDRYEDRTMISIPLTVMAMLLLFAFWFTIPVMILGLFFGLRYSLRGPQMTGEDINQAMDKLANTATDIKTDIKNGME